MNRHWGNNGDVVKHLLLCEVLSSAATDTSVDHYLETHAGYAINQEPQGFGTKQYTAPQRPSANDFAARVGTERSLIASSAYAQLLRANFSAPSTAYPGSPWMAMYLLRHQRSLTFCDTDAAAISDIVHRSAGAHGTVTPTALSIAGYTHLRKVINPRLSTTLVFIDPYNLLWLGGSGLPQARSQQTNQPWDPAGHLVPPVSGYRHEVDRSRVGEAATRNYPTGSPLPPRSPRRAHDAGLWPSSW